MVKVSVEINGSVVVMVYAGNSGKMASGGKGG